MGVAQFDSLFVGEFSSQCSFGDAGFESALHCVASQIKCPIVQPEFKQGSRFFESE